MNSTDYVNTDLTLSFPSQRRKRNNNQEIEIDRFSNLPDTLIHHNLSLLDTKSLVQNSIVSKDWRNHWKHTDSLNFDHTTFRSRIDFGKFIRNVLRRRLPFKLYKLRLYSGHRRNESLIKRIFNYAKSHGVVELETDLSDFPPSFLQCRTLKNLSLGPYCIFRSYRPTSINFSSLTTLQLYYVLFDFDHGDYDFFSRFSNLENLCITNCFLLRVMVFKISAPRLINFTISNLGYLVDFTTSNLGDFLSHTGLVISSPKLRFFSFEAIYPLATLNLKDCPVLDMVKICIYRLTFQEEATDNYYRDYLMSVSEKLSHANSCNVSLKLPCQETFTLERYCHSPFIKITMLEKEGQYIFYYPNPNFDQGSFNVKNES